MTKQNVLRLVAVACVLTLLLVLLLPTLFIHMPVRNWILDELLAQQGIEADIESVSLGWFTPTKVQGVSIGPVDQPRLLIADRIVSDRTLLKALLEGVELGSLTIDQPEIHIWIDNETSNLSFPGIASQSTPSGATPPDAIVERALSVVVNDAKLFIKTPSMAEPANVFRDVDVRSTLQQDKSGKSLLIEPGRIIDHAQISPELCEGGLKYILPILAEATWTKGEFSIDLDACVVDLDKPAESLISGKLHIHGIEAGIKNELLAKASNRLAAIFDKASLDAIHLADNSLVEFQVRDGRVWHSGVEFGLPRVSEDLVVRTSGSVSFDDMLDLTIEVPMPLHLIADGPLAQAFTDKSLTLHATGPLNKPEVRVADDDFVAKLITGIGGQLAEEERPVQSIVKGLREAILGNQELDQIGEDQGGDANGDEQEGQQIETPFLDRIRSRRERRSGPLRRLLGNGDNDEAPQ